MRVVWVAIYLVVACVANALAQTPADAPPRGGGFLNQDPYVGKKKLLVVADVATGFHHDSINHAMATIEKLGRDSGAYIAFLRTDSQLLTKQPIVGVGTRYAGKPVNAKKSELLRRRVLPRQRGGIARSPTESRLALVRAR